MIGELAADTWLSNPGTRDCRFRAILVAIVSAITIARRMLVNDYDFAHSECCACFSDDLLSESAINCADSCNTRKL